MNLRIASLLFLCFYYCFLQRGNRSNFIVSLTYTIYIDTFRHLFTHFFTFLVGLLWKCKFVTCALSFNFSNVKSSGGVYHKARAGESSLHSIPQLLSNSFYLKNKIDYTVDSPYSDSNCLLHYYSRAYSLYYPFWMKELFPSAPCCAALVPEYPYLDQKSL